MRLFQVSIVSPVLSSSTRIHMALFCCQSRTSFMTTSNCVNGSTAGRRGVSGALPLDSKLYPQAAHSYQLTDSVQRRIAEDSAARFGGPIQNERSCVFTTI